MGKAAFTVFTAAARDPNVLFLWREEERALTPGTGVGGNMPVRIGVWLAVVSIALVTQGCWDDQPGGLTLLGEGGCRTEDGGHGESTNVSVTSVDECEAQCFVGDKPCAAVEFNGNNNACEVHRLPITRFEEVQNVSCYVVN